MSAVDYGNASVLKPPANGLAVTPSDTADLPVVTQAIFVGGAGTIALNLAGGDPNTANPVSFTIPAGTWLWVRASRIKATGTSATGIVAMW